MGDQLRAYRFALDLTATQLQAVCQHAGAARWAYNHALATKFAALTARQAAIAAMVESGVDSKTAARQAPRVPTKPEIQRELNQIRGDSRTATDGLCPWWWTVSTYAFQSAFADADRAWSNWVDSLTGRRAGRRVGRPRFKRKNRSRDSFRIHHDVKNPTIRLDAGCRRIVVPRLGSLRTHESTKRLRRVLDRPAAPSRSRAATSAPKQDSILGSWMWRPVRSAASSPIRRPGTGHNSRSVRGSFLPVKRVRHAGRKPSSRSRTACFTAPHVDSVRSTATTMRR